MKKLLFIGGWTRDKRSYQHFYNTAPNDVEILFLPCYLVTHGVSIEASADVVKNYLDENNINRIDLLGHSLGGAICLEFAIKYPEIVSRMYLADSAGIAVEQKLGEKIRNISKTQILHFRYKAVENLRTFLRFFLRMRMNLQSLSVAYYHDLSHKLKVVKSDTTIIWGDMDYIFPVNQGKVLHDEISDSRFILLKNMDHDWIIHSPEKFWEMYIDKSKMD